MTSPDKLDLRNSYCLILLYLRMLYYKPFEASLVYHGTPTSLLVDHRTLFSNGVDSQVTLLHYGSFPFTSVVGSESSPSSRDMFVT